MRNQIVLIGRGGIAAIGFCVAAFCAHTWAAPLNETASAARPLFPDAIRLLEKDDNDVVIKAEELPGKIRDYIAKEMPDARITEARKDYKGNKERTGSNFTYEVDVKEGKKEYELRFASDGKFMKKRENAGDEPDEKK